jgi:exosortase
LLLVAAACWDGWRLLAGRIEDVTGAALVVALLVGLAWGWRRAGASVPGWLIAVSLAAYAAAAATGPALLQIGAMVTAVTLMIWHGTGRQLPRLPLIGLVLLALPILPTLDFLLAYPLRRISAVLTVGLLRMNGVAVDVQGVALEWQGRLLLFDGPCSGIRMLWAALVLASVLALAGRFGPWRYARALGMAVTIAVAGNALRAASLFYLENGFVAPLQGPVAHEAVGLLAFALLGVATIAAAKPRWRIA